MDYIPKLASRIPEGESLASIYSTVENVMYREKGLYPNTDYPIGLLYYLLGIPIPLYTPIFPASLELQAMWRMCWSSTTTTASSGHG